MHPYSNPVRILRWASACLGLSLPIYAQDSLGLNSIEASDAITHTLSFSAERPLTQDHAKAWYDELLAATEASDLARVQEALAQGAPANWDYDWSHGSPFGTTAPLLIAAAKGDTAIAETLMSAGADINAQTEITIPHNVFIAAYYDSDSSDATPLEESSTKKDPVENYIRNHLAEQAAAGKPIFLGFTPLHHAVAGNHLAMVKALLKAGADADIKDWDSKRTALELAQVMGRQEMVGAITTAITMQEAYEARCVDTDGTSLSSEALYEQMHKAIKRNNSAKLDRGLNCRTTLADTQDADEDADLLWHAFKNEDISAFNRLLDKGLDARRDALLNEAARDEEAGLAFVQALISHGLDINATNESGYTPLHDAATAAIAQALIDAGADVNVQTFFDTPTTPYDAYRYAPIGGITPLHRAIESDLPDVVRLLLANGAKVDVRDTRGLTPFYFVRSIDTATALLDAGAEANPTDLPSAKKMSSYSYIPWPPLYNALYNDNLELAAFLLQKGINPNFGTTYETPLHAAVERDRVDIVELLLKNDQILVDAPTSSNITPLQMAKSIPVARALIAAGANIDAAEGWDGSLLQRAARSKNLALAAFLLSKGANPETGDYYHNPEALALEKGHMEMVELLRQAKLERLRAQTPYCQDEFGIRKTANTLDDALISAAECGELENVNLALLCGAKVDAQTAGHTTALHEAITWNHQGVVHRLLEAGADTTLKDYRGRNAVELAKKTGRQPIARMIERKTTQRNRATTTCLESQWGNLGGLPTQNVLDGRLVDAIATKDLEALNAALDCGANPNTNYNGRPLCYTLSSPRIMHALLDAGADESYRCHSASQNLLQRLFTSYGDIESKEKEAYDTLVARLVAYGVDINARDNHGKTPLHDAVENKAFTKAELLLKNGADINAKTQKASLYRDTTDETALHLMLNKSDWWGYDAHISMLKLLLEAKPNLNLKNSNGETVLHRVAQKTYSQETIKLLLKAGASIDLQDSKGRTALHYANYSANTEAVETLLHAGANIDIRDNEGNKPEDYKPSYSTGSKRSEINQLFHDIRGYRAWKKRHDEL